MRLSWFIAKRLGNGEGKGLGSVGNIIAIISVAISILIIIIALAVSKGFRYELKEKMTGFMGDVTVSPAGSYGFSDLSVMKLGALPNREEILNLPYVKSIQGVSLRPAMIKTSDQIQGVVLKGVDSTFDWNFLQSSMLEGTVPSVAEEEAQVLTSKRVADMLSLSLNDKITVYFVSSEVRVRRLTISGIYSAQLENYDKLYLICSKALINKLNGWDEDECSNYQILFNDHSEKLFRERRNQISQLVYEGIPDEGYAVRVSGVYEDLGHLIDWLKLLDMNVLIILILMIAVAGFNMVSCVLIILFENISSIGVLKSLGMKDSGIKRVFLAKCSKTVFYGLILGNVIGIAFCLLQSHFKFLHLNPDNYFISYVPIDISWWTVVLANVICFAALMIILLIPAHYISRIQPSKTLNIK